MGIIFKRMLKCGNCGYEYRGKYGGYIVSLGEHYSVSQYCCDTCHSIIDLEHFSSLKENKEKYFYPDGTEVSYDIEKKIKELNPEDASYNINNKKNIPPFCQKCKNHMFKFDIDSNECTYCPKCGHKSLRQKEIHVITCIED